MPETKCPFCGEPAVRMYQRGTLFRCGTDGPNINGEYDTGHTCDITTYSRLFTEQNAEIERLKQERDEARNEIEKLKQEVKHYREMLSAYETDDPTPTYTMKDGEPFKAWQGPAGGE